MAGDVSCTHVYGAALCEEFQYSNSHCTSCKSCGRQYKKKTNHPSDHQAINKSVTRILTRLFAMIDVPGAIRAAAAYAPNARGINVQRVGDGRQGYIGRLSMKVAAVWALIAFCGLDWMWAHYAGLTFTHWQVIVPVMMLLLALGFFYSVSGRSRQLADMAQYAALLLAFLAAASIFTYITATLRLPLWDTEFASIDSALGFNWLACFHFVEAHRPLKMLLNIAYASMIPQVIVSIIYFSHIGRRDRNDEFWWCALVSLLITAIGSGILPAMGAWVTYGVPEIAQAVHLPHLLALRDGSISSFSLATLQGIVVLPLYHTVLAILLVYIYRGQRFWFPAVATINSLMLISIPTEGGHYLIDMLAGGAVAALSIMAVRAAMRVECIPGTQRILLDRSFEPALPEEAAEHKSNLA